MSLLPTQLAASLHQARQVLPTRALAFLVPQAWQTRNTSSFQNSIPAPQEVHACSLMSPGLKCAGSMPGQRFLMNHLFSSGI